MKSPQKIFRAIAALILLSLLGSPSDAQPAPARTILLIRHGAYDDGAPDNAHVQLVPLGVAQARLVATRLRAWPKQRPNSSRAR
jgi:hypothetical protein